MSISNRLTSDIQSIARNSIINIDFFSIYACKVVSCNEDAGTVDIIPNDKRIPQMQNIPMRFGIGGVKSNIKNDSIVLLGWTSADPSQPYVQTFTGNVADLNITADNLRLNSANGGDVIVNGGTAKVARVGDTTNNGTLRYLFVPAAGTGVATGGSLTIEFIPPSDIPPIPAPPAVDVALSGEIDSGADNFKA